MKNFSFLRCLGLVGLVGALLMQPAIAAAQFVGQPQWRSDPTGVCTYPGRSACPEVMAEEPLPYGGTYAIAGSGDVAAATATATLTGVAAKFTYLKGFLITGGGATGASIINCTITGLAGGTITFNLPVVAGATAANAPLNMNFGDQPWPSSAVNTSIVVSCPTFGSGNAHASVTAWGFTR